MSQTSVDFLNLFVRSPGELLYFFSIIAVSLASLFMSLGQRLRHPNHIAAQHYTIALIGTVVAWITLLGGAILALVTNNEAVTVLPPLERFASVITMLFLTWAFLTADYPHSTKTSITLLAIAVLLTVAGYILTAARWIDIAGEIDFNLSVLGATWTFVASALSILGIILVISNFDVVVDAPLKLVFFVILLMGYAGTLLQIIQGNIIGDYAGPVRLAFLAAFLITPTLVYRTIVNQLEQEIVHSTATVKGSRESSYIPVSSSEVRTSSSVSPIERESVQLLRALGMILEEGTATSIPDRIIKAVVEITKVDVVALLRFQDANYADVTFAYDNVMGRPINGLSLNLDNQPTLVNSVERRTQRILLPDRNREELNDLYTRLDIEQIGPVYFQPLTRDSELVAVLMIAQPYNNRELVSSQEELLKGFAVMAGSLLALSDGANESRLLAEERTIQAMLHGVVPDTIDTEEVITVRQELQASLQLAREQIAQLSKQVVSLKIELDDERSRVAQELGDTEEGLSISQRMLVVQDEQKRLEEERDALVKRLQEAEATLHGAISGDDDSHYKDLIEALEQEKSDLVKQRERLQKQLDELRANDRLMLPAEVQSLLDTMTSDRAHLAQERNQLETKLSDLQSQLQAVGIDAGPDGLAQVIEQLSDQRNNLQNQNLVLKDELKKMQQERMQIADRIAQEEERNARLQALESELRNIAGDREAAIKQRERFRTERDELLAKLDLIKEHRTRLLAQSSAYEMELQEAHEEQTNLRKGIQKLSNERSDLIQERDRLIAETRALATEREQLLARIDGDRERIQELGENGVGSLTTMIDELTQQRNQLEHDLSNSSTKLAEVENQLEAMRMRLASGETPNEKYRPSNPDLLIGLVEELRTPMTSITGYVDLLLGESAGILGEMQRKFLQRVSTNVSRLSLMLDDLIHVTELDTGKFTLSLTQVNLLNIIEDSITNASNQFREKDLSVTLNLAEDSPLVHGDPDAISQIIGQLLTNAYLVSAPSSEIIITAHQDHLPLPGLADAPVNCLFVSVEDRGGGINPEDQQRVFVRKYKAENPLIQGLGDTGVGLSIAKALTEAHGGRLWLETKDNIGSSFNFALPIMPMLEPEGSNDAS